MATLVTGFTVNDPVAGLQDFGTRYITKDYMNKKLNFMVFMFFTF